jgi:hypothetical protein
MTGAFFRHFCPRLSLQHPHSDDMFLPTKPNWRSGHYLDGFAQCPDEIRGCSGADAADRCDAVLAGAPAISKRCRLVGSLCRSVRGFHRPPQALLLWVPTCVRSK